MLTSEQQTIMANETPQQVVILQDELKLYGNRKATYEIKVTEECIACMQITDNLNPKTCSLYFKDIIGCDCMKGKSTGDTSAYLTIYAYPHKKKIIGKKL